MQAAPPDEPVTILSVWEDCSHVLPFRDFEGRWRWLTQAQRRRVLVGQREVWQMRGRDMTDDEWDAAQW